MTNVEALKATVNYPIDDTKAIKILTDRGFIDTAPYGGTSKAFELATADMYMLIVSSANIAEGGYQISMTDKSNLMKAASRIYSKWGVENPIAPRIRDRSNIW
jgi:hypothetical protein